MDYAELFDVIERHADNRDLLMDFDIHLAHHDEYYDLGIERGRKKSRDMYMVSINDSHVGDPFVGVNCSHLDFNYDVQRDLIKDVDIRLLGSLKGQGYGKKLVEVMEETAIDFGCRGIVVGDVSNHKFWKSNGYGLARGRQSGKSFRVKGFGLRELKRAA